MIRAVVRLLTIVGVLSTVLLVPATGSAPVSTAQAADTRLFQAGNIISDEVFFDGWAMDANAIQGFLNAKGANCGPGQMPCLKDYGQPTANQAADPMCAGYSGSAWDTAATIIAKVAQSCGINPRVLLVLLQKEQSLVTRTAPTFYAYEKATGFACPDTAPCNPAFVGFVSQVYFAARQFERYRIESSRFNYKAGRVNTIQWHPDRDRCGSSQVYIANQATAGLYNYTPYQPNQAALDAVTGLGDSCSSYGNRNFWNYFTDWFGTTGAITTSGAIGDLWAAEGGGLGYLGYPASFMFCGLNGGGCGQHFQGGSIYWAPGAGAFAVSGSIRFVWSLQNWQAGPLGYPTERMACGLTGGGCIQRFQGGQIAWSDATGTRAMSTGVSRAWTAAGGLAGVGYPTGDQACGLVRNGCRQGFQGGTVFSSPVTGDHMVSGAIGDFWAARGAQSGRLGYPTTDMRCTADGCEQAFEVGRVGWTGIFGTHHSEGAIADRWTADGGGSGALGHPTSDVVCGLRGSGCLQDFQKATVFWSPASGAWPVSGDLAARWRQLGSETSPAGYPVGPMRCIATGCAQAFQTQWLAGSASTGFHEVSGAIGERWTQLGGVSSTVGLPVSSIACGLVRGGCSQDYQNGSLVWSPGTLAQAVRGELAAAWRTRGATTGTLGYPTGAETCGLVGDGCRQAFEGGVLYWSPRSGGAVVSGAIEQAWTALGAERSLQGYPVADAQCSPVGCTQAFQAWFMAGLAGQPARVVDGSIAAYWSAQGAAAGPLGFPVDRMVCGLARGGCLMTFQGGTVYWSEAGGAHAVFGAIFEAWGRTGYEWGALGYPTGDMVCTASGCSQQFGSRYLAWTSAWGVQSLEGAIATYWTARGAGAGPLGYPIDRMVCGLARGGCLTTFQAGTVYWSPTSGTHSVSGAIFDAWARSGFEWGTYGYPTGEMVCTANGCSQQFQGGVLAWSTAAGTHPVTGAIGQLWTAQGGVDGPLGPPTAAAVCAGSCTQEFRSGTIQWSTAAGAQASVRPN